jgi:hypothetical protein
MVGGKVGGRKNHISNVHLVKQKATPKKVAFFDSCYSISLLAKSP